MGRHPHDARSPTHTTDATPQRTHGPDPPPGRPPHDHDTHTHTQGEAHRRSYGTADSAGLGEGNAQGGFCEGREPGASRVRYGSETRQARWVAPRGRRTRPIQIRSTPARKSQSARPRSARLATSRAHEPCRPHTRHKSNGRTVRDAAKRRETYHPYPPQRLRTRASAPRVTRSAVRQACLPA